MARDSVDAHNQRWGKLLTDLDFDVEGAVTRMYLITRHLKRNREAVLAAHGLQGFELETIHALAGRDVPYRAGPSELAAELRMSPAAMTGRLDGLEKRGFVRRLPSDTDRRKVDIELTPAGLAAWHEAMDVLGEEEERILGVLSAAERRQLADLLRQVNLAAEDPGTIDLP
ncbi:MAG TPA: MarR family transcriptional regulator [Asanoa sp.]